MVKVKINEMKFILSFKIKMCVISSALFHFISLFFVEFEKFTNFHFFSAAAAVIIGL